MKNLIVTALVLCQLVLSSFTVNLNNGETPLDYGHTIVQQSCDCATPFKETVKWSQGSRGGYYCVATSKKSGKQYKRYFSSWLKLKK